MSGPWTKDDVSATCSQFATRLGGSKKHGRIYLDAPRDWTIALYLPCTLEASGRQISIVPLLQIGFLPMERIFQRFEDPAFCQRRYRSYRIISTIMPLASFESAQQHNNIYLFEWTNFEDQVKAFEQLIVEKAIPFARDHCSPNLLLGLLKKRPYNSTDVLRIAFLTYLGGNRAESLSLFERAKQSRSAINIDGLVRSLKDAEELAAYRTITSGNV